VSEIETIRFPVSGMTCASCVNRITRSLRRVDGVSRVKVDLRRETATVSRDPGRVSDATITTAVADAGFEAVLGAAVFVPSPDEGHSLVDRFLRRSR
jgi:Cu+-exporting ATPase